MPPHATHATARPSYLPLRWLQAFGIVALIVFAMVGLHPERLSWAAPYQVELFFSLVAQAHVYLSFLALAIFLRASGYRHWLRAFVSVLALTFLAEHAGLTLGAFGYYDYSNSLVPRIAGSVPLAVPVSWFMMGFACYVFVGNVVPHHALWKRQFLTACFLTCWDLVLDPAMSHVNKFWWWYEPGLYYGVPLSNFVGWLLTGMAISLIFEFMLRQPVTSLDHHWFGEYYLTNFFLSWGIMAAAGLELGCAAALVVLAGLVAVTRILGSQAVPAPYPSGNLLS